MELYQPVEAPNIRSDKFLESEQKEDSLSLRDYSRKAPRKQPPLDGPSGQV